MMTDRESKGREGEVGVTEGVRRTTGVTPIDGQLNPADPEVPEDETNLAFGAAHLFLRR